MPRVRPTAAFRRAAAWPITTPARHVLPDTLPCPRPALPQLITPCLCTTALSGGRHACARSNNSLTSVFPLSGARQHDFHSLYPFLYPAVKRFFCCICQRICAPCAHAHQRPASSVQRISCVCMCRVKCLDPLTSCPPTGQLLVLSASRTTSHHFCMPAASYPVCHDPAVRERAICLVQALLSAFMEVM